VLRFRVLERALDVFRFADDLEREALAFLVLEREPRDAVFDRDDELFVFEREPADFVFERPLVDLVFRADDDFVLRAPDDFVLRAPDDFVLRAPDDFVLRADEDFVLRAPDDFVFRADDDFVFRADDDFVFRADEDFVLRAPDDFVFRADEDFVLRADDDFVFRALVFFLRPLVLREEDVFRRVDPRRPVLADLPLEPDSDSDSSSESSSEPISFFATPTAAGIATPRAVPATTFWVVESPSSSSVDIFTSRAPRRAVYFASLNASMNFGTIRSRTISGPCVARYFPAASAASSASGRRTSDAASQPVAAADARMPFEPERFFDFEPPFELPFCCERSSPSSCSSWSCESAFRTAYVAAVVAAAAAAALSAVLPEPLWTFSCSFS
jgi:hypothetical protein